MKRLAASLGLIVVMFLGTTSLLPVHTAYAGQCPGNGASFFFPRWFDGLCGQNGAISSPAEFGGGGGTAGSKNGFGGWFTVLALNLVSMLLYAVGYVALAFVIYGGFKYITSGDSTQGTEEARKTITNALIGLVISVASVAIVKFITNTLY